MGCLTKRDSSAASLRQYILKHNLTSCFREPFPHGLELQYFQKGEFLCRMGEPMEYFSLIMAGKAQVIPVSEDGRFVLLTNLKPMEMLGDIELLNGCNALHDVCAATDLAVLAIPRKLFSQLMSTNLPFAQLVSKLLADKIYQASMQHSTSMLYPLRCRLSRHLIEETQAAGSMTIPIRMLALAQELGASDRHLRRVLNDLCQEGAVTKSRHSITICNMARLLEISQHSN